jgi:hypothetical protein
MFHHTCLRNIEIIRVGLQVWLTGGCEEGLPSDPPNEIEMILSVLGVWEAQICQIWMFRASTKSKFFTKLEKAKQNLLFWAPWVPIDLI